MTESCQKEIVSSNVTEVSIFLFSFCERHLKLCERSQMFMSMFARFCFSTITCDRRSHVFGGQCSSI